MPFSLDLSFLKISKALACLFLYNRNQRGPYVCFSVAMPNFKFCDSINLLDGGKVVAKGWIVSIDPSSMVHGVPLSTSHESISVVWVLKGNTYIPHVPPRTSQSYAPWITCSDTLLHGHVFPWRYVPI